MRRCRRIARWSSSSSVRSRSTISTRAAASDWVIGRGAGSAMASRTDIGVHGEQHDHLGQFQEAQHVVGGGGEPQGSAASSGVARRTEQDTQPGGVHAQGGPRPLTHSLGPARGRLPIAAEAAVSRPGQTLPRGNGTTCTPRMDRRATIIRPYTEPALPSKSRTRPLCPTPMVVAPSSGPAGRAGGRRGLLGGRYRVGCGSGFRSAERPGVGLGIRGSGRSASP